MKKIYSCEEVAEKYGVKLQTVWWWIRSKRLAAIKVGKFYRIREADLKKFEKATNK